MPINIFYFNAMSTQTAQGFFYLAASLVLSSMNDIVIKAMGSHLPGAQMSFLRFVSAAVMVLIWARYRKAQLAPMTHSFTDILRGLFLFIGMTLWAQALHNISLAQAVLMNFTIPFFQLILGSVVLKERLTLGQLMATCFGFAGVCLSCTDLNLDLSYIPSLLLASCLFASCDLLNKFSVAGSSEQSWESDQLSTLYYTAAYTAAMGLVPAALVWQAPTLTDYVGLIVLGVSSNVLFAFLLKGLSRLALVQTAPFRYMELIVSSFLAYLVFGEVPSMSVAFGAALIIPAALWVVLQEAQGSETEMAPAGA